MMNTYFPTLESMCPRDYLYVTFHMYINYANRGIDMFGGGCLAAIQNNPVIFFRENANSVSNWWVKMNRLKDQYNSAGMENFNEFGELVGYNGVNYGTTE